MHRVSVIIPAYNHARYLPAAIESALAQSLPPLEVLVVDDGSTDATPAVVAGCAERIRDLRQANRGPSAARNAGIAAARGDVLAFLDADDLWLPRKLELQVAKLAADPALGLVHCGVETFDDDGETLAVSCNGAEGWAATDMLRLDGTVLLGGGSSIVVPKRVAEEVGGFDERLLASEDWDFCYRVARRHPIGYVRAPLARYRQHGSGIHLDIPRLEASWLLALEKVFGGGDPTVEPLRRHSYGRVHRILAGCCYHDRRMRRFLRHAAKSLAYDPRNLGYLAAYPLRALARVLARARAGARMRDAAPDPRAR